MQKVLKSRISIFVFSLILEDTGQEKWDEDLYNQMMAQMDSPKVMFKLFCCL